MITGTDHSILQLYLSSYQLRKLELSWANKGKSTQDRGQVMGKLNKTRAKLKKQMNKVAWQLWPETGRPSKIIWKVSTIPGRFWGAPTVEVRGSWKRCNDYIKNNNAEHYLRVVVETRTP